MSCLEKRRSVGDSERISVKSGAVKLFTTGFCFRFSCVLSHFPSVHPTHRHDTLFGHTCSLADRNNIIAYPLIHFFVLSCSKLCTLISGLFCLMFTSTRARALDDAAASQSQTCRQSQDSSMEHRLFSIVLSTNKQVPSDSH